MKQESNIQREIMLALSKIGVRIFRNNVGKAWVGQHVSITSANQHCVTLRPGDVVVRNARRLHAGLCKGSGDLIGWMTVIVTPEMVGKKIAVFASCEVKTAKGRPSPDQKNFDSTVRAAGGVSVIARTTDDALRAFNPTDFCSTSQPFAGS